jgi:hypothetical protein
VINQFAMTKFPPTHKYVQEMAPVSLPINVTALMDTLEKYVQNGNVLKNCTRMRMYAQEMEFVKM